MSESYIYKILSAEDWAVAEAQGYSSTELDTSDGYVHLSTRAQVGETLALHYKGAKNVRLLEYGLSVLEDMGEVKWEASRGGDLFPHLYGELVVSRAARKWTLETDESGCPILPEALGE